MSRNGPSRRQFVKRSALLAAAAAAEPVFLPGARAATTDAAREWRNYGGDAGASRYSPLDQITPSNVKQLKVAWVHHTEDARERPATTISCEPIVIDGVMYIQTAQLQTRALKAATGEVLWNFNPDPDSRRNPGVSRGVTFWQNADDDKDRRIFAGRGSELHCLNANTGTPSPGFAKEGTLDLTQDLEAERPGMRISLTTPAAIYRNNLICGGSVSEGPDRGAVGHIRGFDTVTGKHLWTFHTIPRPGEYGYDTWSPDSWQKVAGGANNWGGMSVDARRGWVFVSTGSAAFDFFGGDRIGSNLFCNCVLALNGDSGERVWHFQTTHHDVWDYDLPCQPALIQIRQGDRTFDAVAQMSKMGLVFLFNRATGEPVFPVEERKVPASDVPGEQLWPTQPFPTKPPSLVRPNFTEDDVTNISPESHDAILAIVRKSRFGAIYTPPSLQGTIVHPGFRGGVEWGGCSFDPKRNRIFVNSDEGIDRVRLAVAPEGRAFRYDLPERGRFRDPEGYPAIKPPWSYMTAIDLDSGDFAWRVIHGEIEALKARGIPKTGAYSTGGSIATAGGLVFIASTLDEKFRAYDSDSGEVVWEYTLPAAGYANPCTYEVDGKQFVTIACGGGKGLGKTGDQFVTFSL